MGEKMTFADVHLASVLWDPIEVLKCLDSIMSGLTHLQRWYIPIRRLLNSILSRLLFPYRFLGALYRI